MGALRLCVIGCGNWSAKMHLPAMKRLAADGQLEFAGVCDLDDARARDYAAQIGAAGIYNDARRMLERTQPDAVVIVVTPSSAPGLIRLAAQMRIPFLVEKPPATDVATHRDLIEAVGNLTHMVAYNRRSAPYILRAKQWLADETPQCVTALFSRYRRTEPTFDATAVHAIDAVRYLAGSDLESLRIETAPTGQTFNFFLTGWTRQGTRIDILITPDTASSEEHYIVRATHRSAVVAFPQPNVMDLPGFVELREENRVAQRLRPEDLGIEPHDLPALGGIVEEHAAFYRAVRENQTQQIREELARLREAGRRASVEIRF